MNTPESDAQNSVRHAIASSGLPRLTGSRADIQRADAIRIDMLQAANERIAQLDVRAEIDRAVLGAMRLRDITRASWWIACQDHEMTALLEDLSHRSCALESGRSQ